MICNPSWIIRYALAQAPYLDEKRTNRILPNMQHSSVTQTPTRGLAMGFTVAKRGNQWIVKRIQPESLPCQALKPQPCPAQHVSSALLLFIVSCSSLILGFDTEGRGEARRHHTENRQQGIGSIYFTQIMLKRALPGSLANRFALTKQCTRSDQSALCNQQIARA